MPLDLLSVYSGARLRFLLTSALSRGAIQVIGITSLSHPDYSRRPSSSLISAFLCALRMPYVRDGIDAQTLQVLRLFQLGIQSAH
jgi:hypothetical protein